MVGSRDPLKTQIKSSQEKRLHLWKERLHL
jgi:hypothetical protein